MYINDVGIGDHTMQAPDFTLIDQHGDEITLSNLRGSKVVLYFYPKADTPGCTIQAKGMRDNNEALKRTDTVVIGISPDDRNDVSAFATKHNINYTLLADPTHEVLNAYGVWKEKTFMGRRFMGVERTTVIVDEAGNIAHRYEKVNPLTHADMILADIGAGPVRKPSSLPPIQRKPLTHTKRIQKPKARKAATKKKSAKRAVKRAR